MSKEAKIIQIMAPVVPMWAVLLDPSGSGDVFTMRVVAIALMEEEDGWRYLEPRTWDPDTGVDVTSSDGPHILGWMIEGEGRTLADFRNEAIREKKIKGAGILASKQTTDSGGTGRRE